MSGSSGEEEAGDEYVVEAICGSRTRNGVRQFEIKWEGFPSSDNTWEPEENLSHSADKLVDFKAAKEKKSTGLPVKKVIAKKKRFFFGAGVR
jgi:chromobox protein 5